MDGKGRILTADLESIGLLHSLREGSVKDLHIICAKDYITGEIFKFFDDFNDRVNPVWLDDYEEGFKDGNILDGVEFLETCDILIMHNVSGFDAIAIEKTVGAFNRNHFDRSFGISGFCGVPRTIDTAVFSRLLNPERKLPGQAYNFEGKLPGPHTIEAHGLRINRHKPKHEDWSHLSIDMIHRCQEDVEIGDSYFHDLILPEIKDHLSRIGSSGLNIIDAYLCELRVAFTMAYQEQRGFAIDVAFIKDLLAEIDAKINSTEEAFRPNMPKRFKMKKLSNDQKKKYLNDFVSYAGPELANAFFDALEKNDWKVSYAATYWKLATANGEYLKNVSKYIPEARGHIQEYGDSPPVHGPFTPLVWEEMPLGNRDTVKQILYKYGWEGVNYNDTELEFMDNNDGSLPTPWSGKIDADSIERWEKSGKYIPEWCKGIAEWYVLMSRRNQILNIKDQIYFDKNKAWPKQVSGEFGCKGLLANSYCHDKDSDWYGRKAQDFYESTGSWPESGHWRVPAQAFSCATNTFREGIMRN